MSVWNFERQQRALGGKNKQKTKKTTIFLAPRSGIGSC